MRWPMRCQRCQHSTWIWQRQRIPIPYLFGTEEKPAMDAASLPRHLRGMACYLTLVVVVSVVAYAGFCWDEAPVNLKS